MKFQIQISVHNYNKDSNVISSDITLDEIQKYTELIKIINNNSSKTTWNWWMRLPMIWNGEICGPDLYNIKFDFKVHFGIEYDENIIIDFYNKFTPFGADGIYWIKIFKIEEIEL